MCVTGSENHSKSLVGINFREVSVFHCESSLALGIHFSTDRLKERPWSILRGRMATCIPDGIPKGPHPPQSPRPRQPAPVQAAGSGGSCSGRKPSNLFPLPFPLLIAVLSSLKSAADENIILPCLMPAQDIYQPVERADLLVWCTRAVAEAWLCLTQPGACWSPLQKMSHSCQPSLASSAPCHLNANVTPGILLLWGIFFLKK